MRRVPETSAIDGWLFSHRHATFRPPLADGKEVEAGTFRRYTFRVTFAWCSSSCAATSDDASDAAFTRMS